MHTNLTENISYFWSKGDLLIVTREQIGFSSSANKAQLKKDFILRNNEGAPNKQKMFKYATIVLAIDPTPKTNSLAQTRVLYQNNIWVLNSHYLRKIVI